MNMSCSSKNVVILLLLVVVLTLVSGNAHAQFSNLGILDNVLIRYSTAASTWAATIMERATWLFWTLALISMVWTFGMMALRNADIGEFFAEFVRFTIFTGFFLWLLRNGPTFAVSIMDSLRAIGGTATGTDPALSPSGIVDIGFSIFFKVIDQSTALSPVDSTAGLIISAAILIIMALIGVNMLLLLISSWILAYAGIFFLGFGGSRWTSEIAINYFRTVLSIAAQLFTMVLLIGIGKSFVDLYYANMSARISMKELGVMLIVAVILLALVNKVPSLIGQLAFGGGTGSLGAGFGTGAVIGAAAMGAAAASTAGASLAAGAFSAGGGAQAMMAAFSKAYESESARDDFSDITSASDFSHGMTSASGAGSGSGNSGSDVSFLGGHDEQGGTGGWPEFPPEYGRGGGGGSVQSTGKQAGLQAGSAGGDKLSSSVGQGSARPIGGSNTSSGGMAAGSATSGSPPSSDDDVFGTDFAGGDSFANSSEFSGPSFSGSLQDGFAANDAGSTGISQAGTEANSTGGSTDRAEPGGPTGLSPGEIPAGGTFAAAGAAAAKVGRIAAGTAVNLAQGTWDVARAKGGELKQAASERISETTGGKIAAAIKARGATAEPGIASAESGSPDPAAFDSGSTQPASDENSLSAGKAEPVDAEAEVAAFRDGNSSSSYPSV